MIKILANFQKSRSGATAVEYGLIAALLAAVLVLSLTMVGNSINGTFTELSNHM